MDDDADTSTTTTRALDTPVSLIVDGCICDKTVADVREAVQQVRDAHQHTLLLEIASDGGSCYAVLAIVDMLRAWLAEAPENAITTYATRAFSAALCLFVLGTTRVASPLASFMNHPASGAAEGDVVKMRQELVEAERVNKICDGLLAKEIGDAATKQLCESGESYLDAQAAFQMGLATHVGYVRTRVDVIVDVDESASVGEQRGRRKRARAS